MKGPDLKVPPLGLLILAACLMWITARLIPGWAVAIPYSGLVALLLAAAGVLICASGLLRFRRVGTTVNPMRPDTTSHLVISGPYRFTRNPMYVGFLIILCGWSVYLSNVAAMLVVPLFVVYLNRFQIAAEEVALERLFGKEFVDYKLRVRRWL